jgi:hypothetical protein
MAEFAASLIGIVSAGTKVALVLSQLANDLGSAGKEARTIANEIRWSCNILNTLKESLERVQKSAYYAHCTELTSEMMDVNVEMLAEVMDVVNSLKNFTERMPENKMKPLRRLQWVFQKPKIIMLRAALDAYRSNLALMLGTLDVAQKATRQTSERDSTHLVSLRLAQRASLVRLETIDTGHAQSDNLPPRPETISSTFTQLEVVEGDREIFKHTLNLTPAVDFAELRDEISSLRNSRSSLYSTNPEIIRSRVSQCSKRFSQLVLEENVRLSQTLSQKAAGTSPDLDVNHDISLKETNHSTLEACNVKTQLRPHLPYMVRGEHWLEHEPVQAFLDWICTVDGSQRIFILEQLPAAIDRKIPNIMDYESDLGNQSFRDGLQLPKHPTNLPKNPRPSHLRSTSVETAALSWTVPTVPLTGFTSGLAPGVLRRSGHHIRAASAPQIPRSFYSDFPKGPGISSLEPHEEI